MFLSLLVSNLLSTFWSKEFVRFVRFWGHLDATLPCLWTVLNWTPKLSVKLSLKQNCSGVGFKFLELVFTCKSIFDDTKDSMILSSREHLFQDLNLFFYHLFMSFKGKLKNCHSWYTGFRRHRRSAWEVEETWRVGKCEAWNFDLTMALCPHASLTGSEKKPYAVCHFNGSWNPEISWNLTKRQRTVPAEQRTWHAISIKQKAEEMPVFHHVKESSIQR